MAEAQIVTAFDSDTRGEEIRVVGRGAVPHPTRSVSGFELLDETREF